MKTRKDGTGMPVACAHCDYASNDSASLNSHVRNFHSQHKSEATNERSEFTPGPWKVDVSVSPFVCKDEVLYSIRGEKSDRLNQNHLANARLIAAAPELLEALKGLFNEYLRAREMINERASESVSQEEAKDAVRIKRAIRELIDKAEGK